MPAKTDELHAPEAYINRELSWLAFSRRVLAQVEDAGVPLFERVKFAGIVGMLHDEFFMKRISGLKRQIEHGSKKLSLDGLTPLQEFDACREELLQQMEVLDRAIREELRPALAALGKPILDYDDLDEDQRDEVREYFRRSVQPILTPLAVDREHPFPFISTLGINIGVLVPEEEGGGERFVRIKVPHNRPRWVPLTAGGFVPLEQVIARNLDLMFSLKPQETIFFRVTRGADGPDQPALDLTMEEAIRAPGSIVRQVSDELKARRFAGTVRLQVDNSAPKSEFKWLLDQLSLRKRDLYRGDTFLRVSDLMQLRLGDAPQCRYPAHEPAEHPRLADLDADDPGAVFDVIREQDVLLHHPYHCFDRSVLRFLQSAAVDPSVLAIKLTIYRTSKDSPTVQALVEAARRGKQVAVVVEITARFDEAPNIAWGKYLENEGVHVSYGVEKLKTHVKLAMVIREEAGRVRQYAHVGTGNYHSGTARIYEDIGVLTCNEEICTDIAAVFNSLTGAIPVERYRKLLVAPRFMRKRFVELIRREAEHAAHGRPSGIHAKMNQLQDPAMIRELYRASQAGVPVVLNVRGLCCLRPGVPKLSENIRLFSVVGRFLEHSRVYRFTNGGDPQFFFGSADWMRRNLNNRLETIVEVEDATARRQLDEILELYEADNCSAWDCGADGVYARRTPAQGEPERGAQNTFIEITRKETAVAKREAS